MICCSGGGLSLTAAADDARHGHGHNKRQLLASVGVSFGFGFHGILTNCHWPIERAGSCATLRAIPISNDIHDGIPDGIPSEDQQPQPHHNASSSSTGDHTTHTSASGTYPHHKHAANSWSVYPWARFIPRAVIVISSHHNNIATNGMPFPAINGTSPSNDTIAPTPSVSPSSSPVVPSPTPTTVSGDNGTATNDTWGPIGEVIRECNIECSGVAFVDMYTACLCPCMRQLLGSQRIPANVSWDPLDPAPYLLVPWSTRLHCPLSLQY